MTGHFPQIIWLITQGLQKLPVCSLQGIFSLVDRGPTKILDWGEQIGEGANFLIKCSYHGCSPMPNSCDEINVVAFFSAVFQSGLSNLHYSPYFKNELLGMYLSKSVTNLSKL